MRSAGVVPPRMACWSPVARAMSRQGSRTGQVAHLLGGVLGGLVVGLGVEQLQVVLPAGGVAEDLEVEGDAAGEAGQVGGQLGRVVGDQAGHRSGRPASNDGHAASPPRSSTGSGRLGSGNPEGVPRSGRRVRRARRALAEASASRAKYALRSCWARR